jgi:kynurenine formamidase
MPSYPGFDELPVRDGAPPGASWGVFGDEDDLGTLNFVGREQVAAAASLVRAGKVFSLNWDLALPSPPFFGRQNPRHTLFAKYDGRAQDDYLDSFWPQASTQWDGLRHFADAEHRYYDGLPLAEVSSSGPGRLGIEHWARRGIAGRGVLLDVARALERSGEAVDPFDFYPIGPELLERTAAEQGVELRPGDLLLVRTGWIEGYERLSQAAREALAAEGRPGCPGLHGDGIPAFLWNRRVAAVASDNPSLEAGRRGTGADLALHEALIARLGMALGELWTLAELAADCARDGVYEAFVTSAPLYVAGGAGSPPNALAIK